MKAFLESPTNRTALAIWLATIITALVQYFVFHTAPSSADLLGVVLGLVKVIEPDSAVTVSQLEKAVADTATAITTKSPAAIESAAADAVEIAKETIAVKTPG